MDNYWLIIPYVVFWYIGGVGILNCFYKDDVIRWKYDLSKLIDGITSSEKTTMLGKIFLLIILFIGYVMTIPALTLDLILLGLKNIINNTIKLTKPLFIRK